MSDKRPLSAATRRLETAYGEVRNQLLQSQFASRLDRPLSHWTMAGDRRLPIVFLSRTLADILNTPFYELLSTPGVGLKKMESLVKLMWRSLRDNYDPADSGLSNDDPLAAAADSMGDSLEQIDPNLVTEAQWEKWRRIVKANGLESTTVGQIAASLQLFPTVIWSKRMSEYLGHTLAELKDLKTHGSKRVRLIVSIFGELCRKLPEQGFDHLVIQLKPRISYQLENFLESVINSQDVLSVREFDENVAKPLLAQLEIDVDPQVHTAAKARLGLDDAPVSVSEIARKLNVTRTRVYQLLELCEKVISIRWPEGAHCFEAFEGALVERGADNEFMKFVQRVKALFFCPSAAQADEEDAA